MFISLGPFCFASQLFNCSHQRIAKVFTQKLPLGKGFGYVVPEHAFCGAYTTGGCHAFFWTYIHISAQAGISISMVLISVYSTAGRSICHCGGSDHERVNNNKIVSFSRILILEGSVVDTLF